MLVVFLEVKMATVTKPIIKDETGQEIISAIQGLKNTIMTNDSSLADPFSTSVSYAVGDYCIYESTLYKCVVAHTGAWNDTHFTSVKAMDEVGDCVNNITILKSGYLPIVNLGTSYTQELKNDISTGAFKKAVVGGQLIINNHAYYLAHPDYWLHTGDTRCTTHHMLVVPAGNLVSGKMNNSDITSGAYVGSDLKTGANSNTALADIKSIIKADFGAANILTHREYFTNAVANGKPSAGAWYDSDIDLMNENMVYGTNIFLPHPDGSTVPNLYTIDKTQIKLFAERPDLITIRAYWWLRDVVSAARFAVVYDNGTADSNSASHSHGVRPAFAIC
jgi:hypothetical protein